jgi:hypothetical protein
MLDKPHGGATTVAERREHALCQKALRHWPVLKAMATDRYGRPCEEVVRLGDPDAKLDPERRNQWRGPRLLEFSGLGNGWTCRGNGAQGKNAIDLVMYLGSCSREKAVDWLDTALSRIVELDAR